MMMMMMIMMRFPQIKKPEVKHICAFVILFVHLLMMMMLLMMRMMRMMTNMEFVEIKICGNSFKSYLHIVHCD